MKYFNDKINDKNQKDENYEFLNDIETEDQTIEISWKDNEISW